MMIALAASLLLTQAPIILPGEPPVGMDYLAYDAANDRVWVPAGNTGNVDVIDATTGKVHKIGGFPTAPNPRPGRPSMGPSSVTVAAGVIWIGDRAGSMLFPVDARTLERLPYSIKLPGMPDGIAYVATSKEVWVTTPKDQSLLVLGPDHVLRDTIKVPGAPEGYAVDQGRGLFYTNLEDRDQTLAIDVSSRKIVSTWSPGCGKEGPRGLALDAANRLLVVACTDGIVSLDLAHDGKVVGRLQTGKGVDNLDYLASRRLVYVAAGAEGKLTVARLAENGALSVFATSPTSKGARNAVADARGQAYVADSNGGRLWVVAPAK